MNTYFLRANIARSIIAIAAAFAVAGCSQRAEDNLIETMPEVNDENCDKKIAEIKNKELQQEFASKCLRRGDFVPSPKRQW